jgi:very-short-patch-repair endonuclease
VAIEVDGGYHGSTVQRAKDRQKEKDCENGGITFLRLTNAEVFGDRELLVRKLRVVYRQGLNAVRRPKH